MAMGRAGGHSGSRRNSKRMPTYWALSFKGIFPPLSSAPSFLADFPIAYARRHAILGLK